jgi:hypothetical protein
MVKQPLYCPNCGNRGIWQDENDPGDVYAGTAMWCFACERELSDILVRDPRDPRQGEFGVKFSLEKYERHRDAALAVEKATQDAIRAGMTELRAFVEQLAIDAGFRVLDICTVDDCTEWYVILADRLWVFGHRYAKVRLDNAYSALLDEKNRPGTTELVEMQLRGAREYLERTQ